MATNNDDTNYYLLELDDAVIALYNKDEVIKELKAEIKRLAEMVSILSSNGIGNLGYRIKNQRHEINNRLKEIDKLKELLLVCRKILEKETYDLMVKKIDNAIGEKK